LQSSEFEALIQALGATPELAAPAYQQLHTRLVRLFRLNNASDPESLADEALDRLARRIVANEAGQLSSPQAFAVGIARHLLQEDARQQQRAEVTANTWTSLSPDGREEEEDRLDALDRCLDRMRPEQAELLRSYYRWTGKAKIEHHRQLAQSLGLNLNALRTRLMRARAVLERCMHNSSGDVSRHIDTDSRSLD
jgi:DNA-directed RNA polymerase specialized sigma24 family protein